MTSTAESLSRNVIGKILTENVGCSFLDSGGDPIYDENGIYKGSKNGYGRNFERNSNIDFEKTSAFSLKFSIYKSKLNIDADFNVYHFLKDAVTFNKDLDDLFYNRFIKEVDQDLSWIALMEKFPQWLIENCPEFDGNDCGGIYGEGKPFIHNTYNAESLLSQTLQYCYFTIGKRRHYNEYALIQVHNGADVRGGYTKPRVFEVSTDCNPSLLRPAQGTIYCTGKDYHPTVLALKERQEKQIDIPGIESSKIDFNCRDHYWTTDNGCYWGEYQGRLDKMDAKDLEKNDVWEADILCVKDGTGYCPVCGAKLALGY